MGLVYKKSLLFVIIFSIPLGIFTGVIAAKKADKSNNTKEFNLGTILQEVLYLKQNKEEEKAFNLILSSIEQQKEGSFLRSLLIKTFDGFLQQELTSQEQTFLNNPNNITAYKKASHTLSIVGDRFQALEVLIRGVSLNLNSIDLWMDIAKQEQLAGRNKDALDVFLEVIRIDKNHAQALNSAAFILAKDKDAQKYKLIKAKDYVKKALILEPKNQDYLKTLSQVESALAPRF